MFIADGRDFADVDGLGDVTMERGRVVDIEAPTASTSSRRGPRHRRRIDCMDCVREWPDGMVTEFPVDIHPDAPDGEWTNTCPTDAIDLDGVTRTVEVDQVIYPGGRDDARGGRLGFYTGPVDAGTIAESNRNWAASRNHSSSTSRWMSVGRGTSQEGCGLRRRLPSRRGRPTDYRLRGVR